MADSPQVSFDDFQRLDIRVGRILRVEPNAKARMPAYCLWIDFGPEVGERTSSAQITEAYSAEELVGRMVLGVVNFPPRRVAGFRSDVLVLGVYSDCGEGPVVLVSPDQKDGIKPGDRLG